MELSRPGRQSNGFKGDVTDERDTAVPIDLNGDGRDDFLWYRPGSGWAGVAFSSGDDTKGENLLTWVELSSPSGQLNGFSWDVADKRDIALPVRLTDDPATSFLFYRPGGEHISAWILDRANSRPEQFQISLTSISYTGDREHWMRDLSYSIGQTPLKSIAIPGSHDAAMYLGMPDGDFAKNQRVNFYDQMKAGARWFDFRFGHFTVRAPGHSVFPGGETAKPVTGSFIGSKLEGYYMYGHSDYAVEVAVAEALRQIRQFLDEHPREIAILSLCGFISNASADRTAEFTEMLKTAFGSLIYDRKDACGVVEGTWIDSSNRCNRSALARPQDVTPEILWRLGKRVILLDELNTKLGETLYVWPQNQHQTSAAYADPGIAYSDGQIRAMTGGLVDNRAEFESAESPYLLLQLNGALTTAGEPSCPTLACRLATMAGPILLARMFDSTLTDALRSNKWKRFQLNIVMIDNLGEGNATDAIIEFNNQQWSNQGYNATAIAAGPDGSVWTVDQYSALYRRLNGRTAPYPANRVSRVAVDNKGVVSIVDTQRRILRNRSSDEWEVMPGGASDIAAGADGSVYVIGADPIGSEGSSIWRWTGSMWSRLPGEAAGTRIAVDPKGAPWVVNASGLIFRYNPDTSVWTRLPAPTTRDERTGVISEFIRTVSEIAIGGDGSVWVANKGSLWRFNGSGWDPFRFPASGLAVNASGVPFVISNGSTVVYRGMVH